MTRTPRRAPRVFATPEDEPRARRASDVVRLAAGVVALVVLSFAAEPTPGFAQALERFVAAVPDFTDNLWQFLADLLSLLAIVLIAGAAVRRRWSIVRDVGLAAALTIIVWRVVAEAVIGSAPLWRSVRGAEPPPTYPSAHVALGTAVIVAIAPHLTRALRRLCTWIVFLAALSLVILGATTALGAVVGAIVGLVAAAAIHLAFGSSGGRPPLDQVGAALAELGVTVTRLDPADLQQAGLYLVHASRDDGADLVVKVYGRDAHDSALLSTVWRSVWFREAGSPLRFGRLQQVEHEAFLTLLAGQAGVLTDRVVTAGATADDDALLVLERRGRLVAGAGGDARSDATGTCRQVWGLVRALHGAGIAHGCLDEEHLIGHDGQLGVIDLRGSVVAASEAQRRSDEVQALVTTAFLVGGDEAARIAVAEQGTDAVEAMLPYLQASVLTPTHRRRIRADELDLDDLRTTAAAAAGADAPPLVQLHRVTIGSLIRVLLPALALIAIISAFAGLDFNDLKDQLQDATWWLVALGLVIAQTPRVSQAASTMGASPVPLPLGPVYALQLAISYINLAVPSTAGRMAINIRFFQRHGVPPAAAVATGAIDGFAGFIVQASLLLGILLFTPVSLDIDVGSAVDDASSLLILVLVIIAVPVLTVLAVGRWRRWVFGWARRLGVEAWGAVRGLRSPRRILLLIGGNLVTEVLFACALAAFATALGFPISIGEALLINISVALLSGLMPIPGGIGVAEGGLTFGLVQVGVPEEVALVIALVYRAASFYLPPTWGFFAFRWLERNEHI
jgi:uncharacterized membrane protein YbhN (UPF0104 family)